MCAANSGGTASRWRATWRDWRMPSHTRHASAAATKTMKTEAKEEGLTLGVTESLYGDHERQDPVGVDRHGDVGARSRPGPHPRGGDGGHGRGAQHHRRGAGVRAAPAGDGPRGDGLVEQVHA